MDFMHVKYGAISAERSFLHETGRRERGNVS
jgi:hypothetical protein